jgi:putative spermidine/putrescine transport system substrate-binding protein
MTYGFRFVRVWVAAIATATAIAVGSGVALAQQNKEVVVSAWGGSYEEAFRKTIIPEFERRFDARVTYVPAISSQVLAKLVAQKEAPQIDVVLFNDPPFTQARVQGLLAPLDKTIVANLQDMQEYALVPGNVGVGLFSSVDCIYYNTEIFKEKGWTPPTSWADLFDPKYRGHVTIHSITNGIGLTFLMMVNRMEGGDLTNVDPGFTKIKTIKPNVLVFDKFSETPKLIQQKQAWIGTWLSDRVANMQATMSFPIQCIMPKEGTMGRFGFAGLVKGGPNPELGNQFINLMLDPKMGSQFAEMLGFGPLNKKVDLSPEIARTLIYKKEDLSGLVNLDFHTVNAKRPGWTERWSKEIEAP